MSENGEKERERGGGVSFTLFWPIFTNYCFFSLFLFTAISLFRCIQLLYTKMTLTQTQLKTNVFLTAQSPREGDHCYNVSNVT